MASPLNRAGQPNNRNLDKPYRPWPHNLKARAEREVFKKAVQDSGFKQSVFSLHEGNGSVGFRSTFGVRVYIPGPKKGRRRESKKKHACRMASSQEIIRLPNARMESLVSLRSQINTLLIVQEWTGKRIVSEKMQKAYDFFCDCISAELPVDRLIQIHKSDEHKKNSLIGLRKEGPRKINLRKIEAMVEAALKIFNV